MSTAKGGNGKVIEDDMLDFEETAPVGRQTTARAASTFVPRQEILDKLAPMLARSGAVTVKGTHATPKDAHKAAANLLAHALVVAQGMDPVRSAAVRIVDSAATVVKATKEAPIPGTPPYTAIVELTHKRTPKEKTEATSEAK